MIDYAYQRELRKKQTIADAIFEINLYSIFLLLGVSIFLLVHNYTNTVLASVQ